MTAIAYRDGVMVADTAMWASRSVIGGFRHKITRLPDGSLVGVCGDGGMMEWFPQWLKAGGNREDIREPPADDGFAALHVSYGGVKITWYNSKLMPCVLEAPFHAIGANELFLFGALYAGASAEQTVRLAIAHTDGAGGDVQIEKFYNAKA